MFTYNYIIRHTGRTVFFVVLLVVQVLLVMGTALSVSDFLRLLFADGNAVAVVAPTVQGNLLAQGLDQLYLWLIGFGKMKALMLFSLLVFVVYSLKNLVAYTAAVQGAVVRAKVVRDIRNDLFAKAMRLPMSYYSSHRKGDMLARFSGDIAEYDENVLGSLQLFINAILSSLLYVAMLLYISPKLTLFVLCMIPIVVFVISGVSRRLKRQSKELQQHNAYLMSLMEETIMGLKVIKAYTAIDFSNDRFRDSSSRFTRLRNRVYRRVYLASPLSEFLSNVVVIGILLFGCYLIFGGDSSLTPELFISYIMMFVLMIEPVKNLSTAISQFKKGRPCADRLQQMLDEPIPACEEDGGMAFDGLKGSIVFDHVDFEYNADVRVLSDFCLTLSKGRTVALVGSSGSGKSTIADLLMRYYDVTGGSITIDGADVRHLSVASLREHIGVVSQEVILFNGSVADNIAFGSPHATREEIVHAACIANAHEFIMQMANGYDTNIGDGGDTLSGGQRQRLSIARAVLRNPDILIMDEATSALDTETERLVQDALDRMLKDRTALVIAHRLSTIASADEIVVLEHGMIVERGTHQTLISQHGRYSELVRLQSFSED